MIRLARLVPVAVALGLVPQAWAQTAPAVAEPARAEAPAAGRPAESERRVIEDDGVRIEELRVRSQPRSIVVQSKLGGVRPYEINVGRGGRDPSQDKSAAGLPSWSLLRF